MLKPVTTDIEALKILDERLRWLSAWTIHHANHIRESADGLKVGGHQASCASMTAIMAALYFHALGAERPRRGQAARRAGAPRDPLSARIADPRARSRISAGFGGAQSYPSRTKDKIPVDFSTGSVGLGVAITLFASLVQDYLTAHGRMDEKDRGRFVALIGDAELDEGNIYEAIIEGAKHDVRNLWWIVDYNRQSLDATSADRMFERFDEIFRSCGWRVVELRYGKKLTGRARQASEAERLVRDSCPTPSSRRSTIRAARPGGRASKRISAKRRRRSSRSMTTRRWRRLFTDLGGHCMETLVEAFDAAQDDVPTLFIAWTIKGFGLPFAGHKDNHAGLMNPTQIAALRESMGVREGHEWEPLEGVGDNARPGVEALLERGAHRSREARREPSAPSRCPPFPPRPATNNRPRPRSAGSCSTSPRPAANSPTGSSPPRPTSPSRPTSAPG